MFKNILIGIFLMATTVFAYLYETERSINLHLQIDSNRYQRELVFTDSINTVLSITNNELDSANKVYQIENANIKWEYEKVQEENDSLLKRLSNMPNDSIAQYIINVFAGDKYRILEIDDSTYIAYKVITSIDIIKQDIAFKALFKRSELLSREIDIRDTLIKMQAKTVFIITKANEDLIEKNILLLADRNTLDLKVIELEGNLDRQKTFKLGSIILNGVLVLILIFG